MEAIYILLVLFVVSLLYVVLSGKLGSSKDLDLTGKHVLVTGGSSGIGFSVAMEALSRGACVSIVARNQKKLNEAEAALKQKSESVRAFALDVASEFAAVRSVFAHAAAQFGPVDILVNCAGTSVSGRFEDISLRDFQRLLEVNYLGSVQATRAVIGAMKERRAGHVVFLSSQAGQIGLYGYTAYSASKFALRGLAEALQMEVKPYNVFVTLAHPPDTDTPGYAEEMKDKPKETRLLSETAGLFSPDYVARVVLRDVANKRFLSAIGVDGWMLSTLTCGMSSVPGWWECIQQVFLPGILRLISLFYLSSFDRIVAKCMKEREERKES